MSGITGFFCATGAPEVGEIDLRRAAATLHQRGSGDLRLWSAAPEIGLAHTQLAFQDMGTQHRQPAVSVDGRWVLAFDGEVHNAVEIRRALALQGHQFRGTGVVEVVLAACREWGIDDAVGRLNGAFAMALWDAQAERLSLARDRMGVKPLYYIWNGRTLCFGSELKALRAYPNWQVRIDDAALADFFRFAYIVEPRSIYEHVKKLGLGHTLQVSRDGQPVLRRYWSVLDDFQSPASPASPLDEEILTDELENLIAEASRCRVDENAEVGLFLSGGVDSSVIAALLQRDRAPIRTFTIGFDDPRYNEAHHAEQVARHLGTLHTTKIVREAEAMQVLPTWGELFDEPFGDSSGIPTLLASRLAAEHVQAVLLADGADELFGTYHSYEASFERMHTGRRRTVGARVARALAAGLPWDRIDGVLASRSATADAERNLGRKVTRHLRYLREVRGLSTPGRMFQHSQTSSGWNDDELNRLLGRKVGATRPTCDHYPGRAEEQMRLWDLENYTSANILTKVDRATMAAGVEAREPLLDRRVVSMALSLPGRLRLGDLGTKHLLRKLLYRHVPRELIERPKMGFSPPIGRWMAGDLKPLLDQYLDPQRVTAQGLLDPDVVRSARRQLDAGDDASAQRVWLLLSFQMWHARWMESPTTIERGVSMARPSPAEVAA